MARQKIEIGSVQIFVGPENISPYMVDAAVFEEDTFLVLSADPEVTLVEEDVERVLAEASATSPAKPGSLVIKNGVPLQMLAIIHDLNRKPSWKEKWVISALDEILREAEIRKLQSIALPLLGTRHGSLKKKRFIALLRQALERNEPAYLKRLWLVATAGTAREVLEILKSELTE